jgi:hypothetical protein
LLLIVIETAGNWLLALVLGRHHHTSRDQQIAGAVAQHIRRRVVDVQDFRGN